MTERLRIGQIGIAHTHATKLIDSPSHTVLKRLNAELVGVYEPDAAIFAERGSRRIWQKTNWIQDPEEILADDSIAVIFVETWPWDCVEWGRRALEAGKHVHIDKPPGTSLESLRELYEIANAQGLFVQMGYQWRFNPGFQLIQQWVRDGLIGRITFARFRAGSTPEYYNRNHVYRYMGGIMMEENCHLFDQVAWMFGKADRITSFLTSSSRNFEEMPDGTDLGMVVFEYDTQGAIAVIEGTSLEVDPGPHRRVEVHGLSGSVILEPIEPAKIQLCLKQANEHFEEGWQEIEVEDRPRYVGDIEEMVGVVRGERDPLFSAEHDLVVHEMLLEACGGLRT